MALLDYRKLCPRSGHALTREERDALAPGAASPRAAQPIVRCDACGRDVALVLHPGTGRSFILPMHVRDGCGPAGAGDRAPCRREPDA